MSAMGNVDIALQEWCETWAWGDLIDAVSKHLGCGEAATVANLLEAYGHPGAGDAWRAEHMRAAWNLHGEDGNVCEIRDRMARETLRATP